MDKQDVNAHVYRGFASAGVTWQKSMINLGFIVTLINVGLVYMKIIIPHTA